MIHSFSLSRVVTSILPFLAAASLLAQDFDYGDTELTPDELYDQALQHLYGLDGYTQSRSAAMSRLKKAAELDFAPAHNMLGLLYLEGNGLFTSPRKALRSFEQAAQMGDALGQYNAGYSYLVGRGTPANLAQAEKHLLAVVDTASTQNLSPEDFGTIRNARASAYLYLGLIYGDEDDKDRFDETKATKMYHQADALNEPSAAMLLAIRYARGEGVQQDQEQSAHYLQRYKLAAVNKFHNSYSQAFFQGMDRQAVSDSLKELVASYEDQMRKRIQSMQTSFGVSLLDEEDLFDPAQAYVWLKPVANKESPLACSRLATLYYRGEGAEQNLAQARQLLEIAYKQIPMAEYNLGVMLIQGEGGPADPERGTVLIDRAAKNSWYPAIHYKNPCDAQFITERDAITLVKTQAAKNDPDALYCLGRRKLFGIGIDQEFENAKALILQAAELGNAQARYFYGVYIAKDFSWLGKTEETKAIQAAADAGHPPAIHHLGSNAEYAGRYKIAIGHYQKAAQLGHTPSLYKLGKFYRDAHGVERDYAKALDYFQQAAELEDPIGLLNLGLAYEYGHGVEIDAQKAYQLYQDARDLGSYYAHFTLGNLLASGKLGQSAWEEAIAHWEQAAEYRIRQALIRLGDAYRDGTGVTPNRATAISYYNNASRLSYYGDPQADLRLRVLKYKYPNENGKRPPVLIDIRIQETTGDPLAGYELALLNLEGIGLKQNDKKAYNKFLKVAKQLGKELETQLGTSFSKFYDENNGLKEIPVPTNFEEEEIRNVAIDSCYQIARLLLAKKIKKTQPEDALAWFKIAAKLGHHKAQFELGQLYLDSDYTPTDNTKGWNWILKAAQKLPEAKYYTAHAFLNGTTDALNREQAIDYLRDAAAAGHPKAKDLLSENDIPLDPESKKQTPADKPQRKGEDDGFDGAIDLDVA